MRHLLLAPATLMACVAFAANKPASCDLASESIVSRSSSGLAQVSNVGDIQITCSVPARAFPTQKSALPLYLLKVETKVYEISRNGSEKLVPSETKVTGGMTRGLGPVPTGREGVFFYLHIPLDPAGQDAEAQRYLAKFENSMQQEHISSETRRRAMEDLKQFIYQHRVGVFRVKCRLLDGKQVIGTAGLLLEVLFKGRFSDLGLPGAPPV